MTEDKMFMLTLLTGRSMNIEFSDHCPEQGRVAVGTWVRIVFENEKCEWSVDESPEEDVDRGTRFVVMAISRQPFRLLAKHDSEIVTKEITALHLAYEGASTALH
ncbi:MAG: hypothetical protein NUV59_04335 [Patescibacteria group bacterium]|nr:hypothetical protein [Patescibacteria group bacterium]